VIKPKDNLLVARFTFPALEWRITDDDQVFAPEPEKYFSLYNVRDIEKARIVLFSKGWKITDYIKDGQQHWKAIKHTVGKFVSRGEITHQDLKRLIVQLVEIENGK
jgi:hypothetical protein